ncbi:MAG: hypothetical protein MJY61_00380 [Bacteroidales bacterium]|nr:hypothetical protein [Bacteroidales bacterium]
MKRKILTYFGAAVFFLLLSYAYVPQVLGGKIVNQSDISGWQGMVHETAQWNSSHPSDQTFWTGSMFGGMPNVTIQPPVRGDWTRHLYNLLLTGKRPATYFFISLVGAFLLLLSFGVSPLVAVGGAVAVTFCSYNLQIIQVGHNTKMQALAFLPWVLAAVVFTYRRTGSGKRRLPLTVLGSALFGLALSFQVKANHPQITYYLAIMIFLYVIFEFVWALRQEDRKRALVRFAEASGLLLVLGLAGIGTNANKLIPTWEYTEYSMRGGTSKSAEEGGRKGLDLDYATSWSYGWEELPNLLIPNYNGGSSAGELGKDSRTVRLLAEHGQANVEQIRKALPLYWGPQPFTAGPMYMGAVTIFLFILGLFLVRGKEKWWVIAATFTAVLLSLGNHFLWFTRLFYDYVPLYNKFRTVSMALTVLQFTLPVLGFIALDKALDSGRDYASRKKALLKSAGITAGICLVLALLQSLSGTFVSDADSGQPDILVDALSADRQSLMWADTFRSIIFVALAFAALLWGMRRKENNPSGGSVAAAAVICALVIADLFSVGRRYLDSEDFISPARFKAQFEKRPADEKILEDKDPSYRVLDLSVNVFNDSHPSYWHKNIGGYSPAKLQIYQEYIDNHLAGEISILQKQIGKCSTLHQAQDSLPELPCLSKLNCRYIILSGNLPPLVNPYARGPVWFEKGEGTIELNEYAPNQLIYDYDSENGGKAVFSEVYYPAGWVARLDTGEELPIALYDEVFRSVDLPAGHHMLIMSFEPRSFRQGEKVSRGSSIALTLLVLLSIAGAIWKREE